MTTCCCGVDTASHVVPHDFPAYLLVPALKGWPSMARVTAGIADAPRHELSDVTWLPVIPNPGKILCVGLDYENHRKETGRTEVENPPIFTRFTDSQTGHLGPLPRPRVSSDFDYEGELGEIAWAA